MTTIEWTDQTWNPTTGCDRVSPGCDNCYALNLAPRLKGMEQGRYGSEADRKGKYQTDGDPRASGPGFGLQVHPDTLDAPLRWRKPRRVFVDSMSDLFHPKVPDEFITQVFSVMRKAEAHTFQVLTKRPARMRSLLRRLAWRSPTAGERAAGIRGHVAYLWDDGDKNQQQPPYVLPNVWLGTSVEDQRRADERIPALLETPAAVRFLSCEPLLGHVDIDPVVCQYGTRHELSVDGRTPWCLDCDSEAGVRGWPDELDWLIVGGESGANARPMDPEWARSLRDQCVTAGVPFFFKQWGGRTPKAGGRTLDGRTWDQYPDARG